MGTEEAKEIYKERAATAECVNAQARERGLTRLRVRGTAKVRCVLLLHALAHNLMRTLALAPHWLGTGEVRLRNPPWQHKILKYLINTRKTRNPPGARRCSATHDKLIIS